MRRHKHMLYIFAPWILLTNETLPNRDIAFHHIAPQEYLIQIIAHSGAYQPGYLFLYHNENTQETLTLKLPQPFDNKDGNEAEIMGIPSFDEYTKQLTILTKHRGSGDCGTFLIYSITNQQPQLIEARYQPCDDIRIRETINPRTWPIVKWLDSSRIQLPSYPEAMSPVNCR